MPMRRQDRPADPPRAGRIGRIFLSPDESTHQIPDAPDATFLSLRVSRRERLNQNMQGVRNMRPERPGQIAARPISTTVTGRLIHGPTGAARAARRVDRQARTAGLTESPPSPHENFSTTFVHSGLYCAGPVGIRLLL